MIGIIGAMEQETSRLKSMVKNKKIKTVSGVEFVSGELFSKEVVVATCGVGKVFAAICAEAMILEYRPDLIVNTGVGGSLCEQLGIADVCVADYVVQHDMDTTALGDPKGLLSGINLVKIPCSHDAAKSLSECLSELSVPHLVGTICSGDQFVNTREDKLRLRKEFGAAVCEMEGASIGHVCYVNQTPFAVLRAVSDSFADDSHLDYQKFVSIAADNAIRVLSLFLQR